MNEYGFSTFAVLALAGSLAAVAVIPYTLGLAAQGTAASAAGGLPSAQEIPLLPQIIQGVVLASLSAGVGLLAARSLGFSIFSAPEKILPAALIGIAATIIMLALEFFVFLPHMPELQGVSEARIAVWKRILASFYGGITEELLMRFFLMSGILWLLHFVWHTPEGTPAVGAVWLAILLVAILFGLGHLPATRMLTALTPLVITRALVLNGVVGIACGWLYWRYGLVAAMVSHFSADIILHVLSPFFGHGS